MKIITYANLYENRHPTFHETPHRARAAALAGIGPDPYEIAYEMTIYIPDPPRTYTVGDWIQSPAIHYQRAGERVHPVCRIVDLSRNRVALAWRAHVPEDDPGSVADYPVVSVHHVAILDTAEPHDPPAWYLSEPNHSPYITKPRVLGANPLPDPAEDDDEGAPGSW